MGIYKSFGYLIAILHGVIMMVVTIIPFISSSLPILLAVFVFDLLTVISWVIFNNKCIVTIVEEALIGDNKLTLEEGGSAYFNRFLGIWISPSFIRTYNTMRPYCMMFFTGCKMLPILAVICLLYTSPSPRDRQKSRMPSSA